MYKLQEIDQKHRLLRPGANVLDLGCRPGSWLQYATRKVGPSGNVVGLDREPLSQPPPEGARVVVGDVFDVDVAELRQGLPAFDVLLSDMAPDTTGIRSTDQARAEALLERALDLAEQLLAPGGHAVIKVFQSPGLGALRERARRLFHTVDLSKPPASRKQSSELYLLGMNRR